MVPRYSSEITYPGKLYTTLHNVCRNLFEMNSMPMLYYSCVCLCARRPFFLFLHLLSILCVVVTIEKRRGEAGMGGKESLKTEL